MSAHGIDLAIEHLVELGHRRTALLTVDPFVQDKTYGFTSWALEAYERACARNDLPALVRVGGPTSEELFEVAGRLLDEQSRRHRR